VADDDTAARELQHIHTWLGQHGFPLEYDVALAFRRVGFSVQQGVHYLSYGETVPREIDLVAIQPSGIAAVDPTLSVHMEIVVECKHAPRPWLVFTADADPDESPAGFVLATRVAQAALLETLVAKRPPFWTVPPRYGFNVAQTDLEAKQKTNRAYEAVTAAVNGAVSRLSLHSYDAAIAIPVVVLAGPLYEYRTDVAGEPVVAPVPRARLQWDGGADARSVFVDLVTADALAGYANLVYRTTVTVAIDLMKLLQQG
jgi:hypothetical protein